MHLSFNNSILSGAVTICYTLLSGRSYSDLATCLLGRHPNSMGNRDIRD